MKIGIPREEFPGENRVAISPGLVPKFAKLGYEVVVETTAGERASYNDSAYEEAGASIVSRDDAWSADLVLKVRPPIDGEEIEQLNAGTTLICLFWPRQNEELAEKLGKQGISLLALDAIPRISRAQSMDVLSSMAAIAGYRAVVEAATNFGKYMSQQFTAAGSTDPARVLVIGAGVAGLAAIATAREMGARVIAFDTREAVKEEVESLGGEFLTLEFDESGEGEGGYAKVMSEAFMNAERELFEEEAKKTDIFITTANIPGKEAPMLLTTKAVENMKTGSVIIDLAAETGGNCEATVPGEVHDHKGVKIVGHTNLVSRLPAHASQFFGQNLHNIIKLMTKDDGFVIDEDDEVVRGMLVLRDGEDRWPPPKVERPAPKPAPVAEVPAPVVAKAAKTAKAKSHGHAPEPSTGNGPLIALAVTAAVMGLAGAFAPTSFIQHLTVFVLACFVGWQLIWNVAPALHTPLMSVTNAISGIIIVGGILQATTDASQVVLILSAVAILVASINIFGGFLVTQRMLKMFRGGSDA